MSKLQPYKNHKLNGVTIEVLCPKHGDQVYHFWQSVGIKTPLTCRSTGSFYGIINGVFRMWDDDVDVTHANGIVLTIQEATEMWHLDKMPKGIGRRTVRTFG